MHPPLATPQRQLACGEFIEALQRCHASAWWKRFTGECNAEKRALSTCLRKERIDRTNRNAEDARRRRAVAQQVREELEND